MPNVKISQLPYVGKTGFTSNDIVPFVNYINPTGTTSETKIDDIKDYVLDNTFIQNIIKVGKGGNIDFTTVSDAVNSITGSSPTNRYVIQIGPGFYIEPEINLIGKEHVNLVGSEIKSTIILPDLNTNTIFRAKKNGRVFTFSFKSILKNRNIRPNLRNATICGGFYRVKLQILKRSCIWTLIPT